MWIVEARELKTGGFRLIANSDEDGGFHECCQHVHPTRKEAEECEEARGNANRITGFATAWDHSNPLARVTSEKVELDVRKNKLSSFIGGLIFPTLKEDEQKRLKRQLAVMTEYSDILGERLEAAKS